VDCAPATAIQNLLLWLSTLKECPGSMHGYYADRSHAQVGPRQRTHGHGKRAGARDAWVTGVLDQGSVLQRVSVGAVGWPCGHESIRRCRGPKYGSGLILGIGRRHMGKCLAGVGEICQAQQGGPPPSLGSLQPCRGIAKPMPGTGE